MMATATKSRKKKPIGEVWQVGNTDYHADMLADSSTSLKLLLNDPEVYYRCRVAKTHPTPRPAAESVNLGSAFEIALLEPELFEAHVHVARDAKGKACGYRAKGYQTAVDKYPPDHVVVTQEDFDKIEPMLASVRSNAEALELVESTGHAQLSVRWTDPATGCLLKCRFDKLLDDGRILQLKTARDAGRDGFAKQVGELHYHTAEALYRRARQVVREIGEPEVGQLDDYKYLVVEKEWPHKCRVYHLGPKSREDGERWLIKALGDLAAFRAFHGVDTAWQDDDHGRDVEIEIADWQLRR